MNPLSALTASILTSTSESFSRFASVWMILRSVTSFPKFEAIYVKFFDRANLTLHDLSSAAWIISGMINVLFSSLLRTLAIDLND